jgi:hypothetical protein
LTASLGRAASPTLISEVKLSVDIGGKRVPLWSAGRLLVVDKDETPSPEILVLNRGGSFELSREVRIPGAQNVRVNGFARGGDGTIVATGFAIDGQGRGGLFLAIISPDGSMRVIRTNQYQAYHVVVSADGSLWTSGIERLDHGPADDKPLGAFKPYLASGLIRHFDSQGNQLASFIPQSTVQDFLAVIGEAAFLASEGNRVGWYSPREQRYVEIDAGGSVLDLKGIPAISRTARPDGLALAGGSVFLAARDDSGGNWIWELDKAAKKWSPVRRENGWAHLYGGEGNALVAVGADRFTMRFLDVSK